VPVEHVDTKKPGSAYFLLSQPYCPPGHPTTPPHRSPPFRTASPKISTGLSLLTKRRREGGAEENLARGRRERDRGGRWRWRAPAPSEVSAPLPHDAASLARSELGFGSADGGALDAVAGSIRVARISRWIGWHSD
jgi:hypothetical protein